jgi:hypothetical protein
MHKRVPVSLTQGSQSRLLFKFQLLLLMTKLRQEPPGKGKVSGPE